MLIKLTALSHPDLNGGRPVPVYLDASRILLISRSSQQYAKLGAETLKREVYEDLWSGMKRLEKLLNERLPTEIDNQETAKWAKEMHMLMHDVQACYAAWGQGYRQNDYHPRVECTEVQLACGTALEHGVILTRVWVTESPEEVARAIDQQWSDPRAALSGLPR